MTFSAKLDPAEKVTFNLRYEELLQRSEKGQYNYEVNIQPKNQKISDFKIKVAINESLPLDGISVTRVKDKDEAKFQAESHQIDFHLLVLIVGALGHHSHAGSLGLGML